MTSINEVYPGVFISDGPTAGDVLLLTRLGITGVVNVTKGILHQYPSSIESSKVTLSDEHPNDAANPDDQIVKAVSELSRMYRAGKKVLSHCRFGHNRSGAIVAGMLASLGKFPNVREAHAAISLKRELHIQPRLIEHFDRLFPCPKNKTMKTLYIAGTHQDRSSPYAHCLGDVITSIRVAWIWFRTEQPDKIILSLCENERWNPLWAKFIRETPTIVVYDKMVDDKNDHYWLFDERRRTRMVNGIRFDTYKELYCRIEGGTRQSALCGSERGLGRKNIFEYFYYGQEDFITDPIGTDVFGTDVLDFINVPREHRVLIAPVAKCQGNHIFTFDFWADVVHRTLDAGIEVTLNDDHDRLGINRVGCEVKHSTPAEIANYVARHALVVCGNTGIGWVAGATGTPLMGMEPPYFDMMDFRYKECGVQSLKRLFSEPDPKAVATAICEFMSERKKSIVIPIAPPAPVTAGRKLENMVNWLKEAPPGPVVEVGVYQGGSLIHLASRFPGRQFYGYDTFEGIPEATNDLDNFHRKGDFSASFEDVKSACDRLPNITLVKGIYPTSDTIRPNNIALAHVDVDIYESTKATIEHLIPLMGPKSRLYCDDAWMDTCEGATIAMCEVAAAHKMFPKFDHGWHAGLCFGDEK